MTRTRYYTASSADGFIATQDHSLEWLFRQQIDQDAPLGYTSFIRDIGSLAMGASTYAWIRRHMDATGEAWAYDIPCWVFTHRTLDVPAGPTCDGRAGRCRRCTPTWWPPPAAATCGSWAVGISPVSSPTTGCWTR